MGPEPEAATDVAGPGKIVPKGAAQNIDGIAQSIDRLLTTFGGPGTESNESAIPLARLERLEAAVRQLREDVDGAAVDIDDVQARMDCIPGIGSEVRDQDPQVARFEKELAKLSSDVDWRLEAFRHQLSGVVDAKASPADSSTTSALLDSTTQFEAKKELTPVSGASELTDSTSAELKRDIAQLSSEIKMLKRQATAVIPEGQDPQGADPALAQLVHDLDAQLKINLSILSDDLERIGSQIKRCSSADAAIVARLEAFEETTKKNLTVLSIDQKALKATLSDCTSPDLLQRVLNLESFSICTKSKFHQDLSTEVMALLGPQQALTGRLDQLEASLQTMSEHLTAKLASSSRPQTTLITRVDTLEESFQKLPKELKSSMEAFASGTTATLITRVDALEESFQKLPKELKSSMEAFASGTTAYISEVQSKYTEVQTALAANSKPDPSFVMRIDVLEKDLSQMAQSLDTLVNKTFRTSTSVGWQSGRALKCNDVQISHQSLTSKSQEQIEVRSTAGEQTPSSDREPMHNIQEALEQRLAAVDLNKFYESNTGFTLQEADPNEDATSSQQQEQIRPHANGSATAAGKLKDTSTQQPLSDQPTSQAQEKLAQSITRVSLARSATNRWSQNLRASSCQQPDGETPAHVASTSQVQERSSQIQAPSSSQQPGGDIHAQNFQTAIQKEQAQLRQQRLADLEHFEVQDRLQEVECSMQEMLQQLTNIQAKLDPFLDAQVVERVIELERTGEVLQKNKADEEPVIQAFCNTWKEDLASMRKEIGGLDLGMQNELSAQLMALEERWRIRTDELHEGIQKIASTGDASWHKRTEELVEKVCKVCTKGDGEMVSRKELAALEDRWHQRIVELAEDASRQDTALLKGLVTQEQEVLRQQYGDLQRKVQQVSIACGLEKPLRRPLGEAPASKRPVGGSVGVLRSDVRPSAVLGRSNHIILNDGKIHDVLPDDKAGSSMELRVGPAEFQQILQATGNS